MQKLAPEEWKRVLELLDAALDLPVGERDTWIEAVGAENSALKPALRELLARHAARETDDFLNALPQFTRIEAVPGTLTGELAPESTIGVYRLIRELGRGG